MDFFANRRGAWRTMQRIAMTRDFSWERAAREYLSVYRAAMGERT